MCGNTLKTYIIDENSNDLYALSYETQSNDTYKVYNIIVKPENNKSKKSSESKERISTTNSCKISDYKSVSSNFLVTRGFPLLENKNNKPLYLKQNVDLQLIKSTGLSHLYSHYMTLITEGKIFYASDCKTNNISIDKVC